jgi:hypothetical protein
MIRQVRGQREHFVWECIRSVEHLEEVRMGAMEKFLVDFSSDVARKRYRVASLPKLEFADGEFELGLCSHFLFLYSEWLDEEFHLASVRELLRVAKEVRIFPVTEMDGRVSRHLAAVREKCASERVRVEYEFLRNANQMLIVRR